MYCVYIYIYKDTLYIIYRVSTVHMYYVYIYNIYIYIYIYGHTLYNI